MPSARPLRLPAPPLDFAGFDRFVAHRPDHERWELHDGVLEMQPYPSAIHQQVVTNLTTDLFNHAERTNAPWTVFPGFELRFRATALANIRTPDIVVIEQPTSALPHADDALVLIEVGSPGARARKRDLVDKPALYATLAQLSTYPVVSTEERRVTVFDRAAGFAPAAVTDPDQPIPLPALATTLTLRALYRRTTLAV